MGLTYLVFSMVAGDESTDNDFMRTAGSSFEQQSQKTVT